MYESVRYEYDVPVFATTDSVFHIYHLIFDKMLRDLERQYFIPDLEPLTTAMFQASLEQYQQLERHHPGSRPPCAIWPSSGWPAACWNCRWKFPPRRSPGGCRTGPHQRRGRLNAFTHLGSGGLRMKKLIEDYSQYIPRGHYTRSEELRAISKP